jgi:hypothetical protein
VNPLEYSEDRQRGRLAHIERAIEALRGVQGIRCERCRRPATHLVAARRASCAGCARDWQELSPLERRRSLWGRR